ncbi:pilus assembly protein TadG [Burkholderia ubonensis]|uniref:TadE/TadG family type IV pilus assembly protein n=1 Tax=Burkholderia ubonensis TaxID=101571 RepID=UPI0008FE0423|nr:TadE family protein [Burkholderia ubonensis]OJA76163.1 pilus assembly protein TadG [Burkholderia ubonensis]
MKPRTRSPLRCRGQRGATVVEFALVAAIFCTLLIGICEFGRVLFYWNTASEAMRLGARTATVCDADANVIKQRITTLMPLLKSANVSLSYAPSGCDSDAATARSTCTFVTLKVTNITIKTLIPFLKVNVAMPPFTTTLPRESLMSSTGGTVCN